MDDLISRQAAIDALITCYETETITMNNGNEYINYDDAVYEIEELPSAQLDIDRQELIRAITAGIVATNTKDVYSCGMRNGMRWCRGLLEEDAPKFEDASMYAQPDLNDGWILCSERMPEEEDSMFAKYYGTDKWHRGMFRKRSEHVDVTVVRSDGMREVTSAKTCDGEWRLDTNFYLHSPKVIAWKPKVEPYMGEVKDGD